MRSLLPGALPLPSGLPLLILLALPAHASSWRPAPSTSGTKLNGAMRSPVAVTRKSPKREETMSVSALAIAMLVNTAASRNSLADTDPRKELQLGSKNLRDSF